MTQLTNMSKCSVQNWRKRKGEESKQASLPDKTDHYSNETFLFLAKPTNRKFRVCSATMHRWTGLPIRPSFPVVLVTSCYTCNTTVANQSGPIRKSHPESNVIPKAFSLSGRYRQQYENRPETQHSDSEASGRIMLW